MRSTPLIASSSGVPTACARTVGFAPGYIALTVMVGGVTSGYSLIGSCVTEIIPPARITSDSTTAKIGRSIKKREKRTGRAPEKLRYRVAGAGAALSATMEAFVAAPFIPGGLPDRRRLTLD